MPRKLTTKEFIDRAKAIHGDCYDYSLVEYKNAHSKIKILCREHGIFEQQADSHLRGNGCSKCSNTAKLTTQEFIERAKAVHGDRYDYSLVDYKCSNEKVTIICREHGIFEQTPAHHTNDRGCPTCSALKRQSARTSNTEVFIEKAKTSHGDKSYDYSLVDYKRSNKKVTIICREHGIFEQTPNNHMRGKGCPKCGALKRQSAKTSNTEEFVKKAKSIHGDRYDYSEVVYKNSQTKVKIICPDHEEFEQAPSHHTHGEGCPKCAQERVGWTRTSWKEQGENSKHFDSFKLYVVKLTNETETETFLKVGITFTKLHKRMFKLPYQWVEVLTIEGSSGYIYDLENEIHREIKDYQYTPQIEFKGQTECFSIEALEEIKEKFAKRDIIN